jgi:hypothetical protein
VGVQYKRQKRKEELDRDDLRNSLKELDLLISKLGRQDHQHHEALTNVTSTLVDVREVLHRVENQNKATFKLIREILRILRGEVDEPERERQATELDHRVQSQNRDHP